MRKLLTMFGFILLIAALIGCTTYKDGEPVVDNNNDNDNVENDNSKVEEVNNNNNNDSENNNNDNENNDNEQQVENLRELDQDELELWNDTDKPYLKEKHDIIESIGWAETEIAVELKEKKVTGIVEDNLYDATNQIGEDIQEIVDWNYDVENVPVTFYVDSKIVSKQNEHGIWTNFKMSNWED